MKIHSVQNPPAGLTFGTVQVESVEIIARGNVRVKFVLQGTNEKLSLVIDYDSLSNLPAPGDIINLSLWFVP